MRPSGSSNKPQKVKPAFSASLSDGVFAGAILRTIWRASVAVRKYSSMRFIAAKLRLGVATDETLRKKRSPWPGPTRRARFTSMKPSNRLLAQSNTPKARRGPPLRQLSWLFRMNASTVAACSVRRLPTSPSRHLHQQGGRLHPPHSKVEGKLLHPLILADEAIHPHSLLLLNK